MILSSDTYFLFETGILISDLFFCFLNLKKCYCANRFAVIWKNNRLVIIMSLNILSSEMRVILRSDSVIFFIQGIYPNSDYRNSKDKND